MDDHEIVRKGVRGLLGHRWEVCGEAYDGKEAVEKAVKLKPDLVVMDPSMPTMNGLEATRQIRELGLPTRIVIFSVHNASNVAHAATEAGADACLAKTCASSDLLAVIEKLLEQNFVATPLVAPTR